MEHVEKKVFLGELLVQKGLLTKKQVEDALETQKKWGSRLGDIILARGWVRPFDLYKTLAGHFDTRFVNLLDEPPDHTLFVESDLRAYSELLILPWKREEGKISIAIADPSPEVEAFIAERYGVDVVIVFTSKFDIIWQLQKIANTYFSSLAVNELLDSTPLLSARSVISRGQGIFFLVTGIILLVCLSYFTIPTLTVLNVFITIFLLLNFGMRAILVWVGGAPKIDIKVTDDEVDALQDHDLPTFTVLVPLYKEAAMIPQLAAAFRKLDYPLSKLDIKLVLEEDDQETIEHAKKLGLEGIFEIIRVPDSQPKTKPKACNYALNFSRGELITIYDAEDTPDPDQLKKVVLAFRKAPENTACIQARLNYFNFQDNWLTRMFTLEYSLWFDFYLPALEALKIPIPLGGTSCHFKMDVLRKSLAWDPYNVTEDADLGVRLTQQGYRVGIVNSTTYEEANKNFFNWIRQRSRWIKGYMQTYLVHMRHPIYLYRTLKPVGFWGFQFFIGGTIISSLIVPVLYAMFLLWFFTNTRVFEAFHPSIVLYIGLFNLLLGNGFLIYTAMIGAFKRHLYILIPYALMSPVYWIMISIGAYKALWQLIHNPFYWEKTVHGLTSVQQDQHGG